MGGEVSLNNLAKFEYESSIAELKQSLTSNVIPIGMVGIALYCIVYLPAQ